MKRQSIPNPQSRMTSSIHFSSASDEWATPADLFGVLSREFHFTLDAAATAENAKCARFFTKEDDALEQDWQKVAARDYTAVQGATIAPDEARGAVWLNPPYSRGLQAAFLQKAQHEAGKFRGPTVVCLIPARTDTKVWHDTIFGRAEVRFLKGRLRFGDAEASAPFPSALVVFGRNIQPRAYGWDWKLEERARLA